MQTNRLPTQLWKDRSTAVRKQEWYIFFGVLFYGFLAQLVSKAVYGFGDKGLWANQIQYLLNHDPQQFSLYGAYGHPGTPLVELGSLFHIVFGFSYDNAVTLSMSILIATATAACCVLCFLLYRRSLWWLATAFILLFSRLYFIATPPTAIVMPYIVLIVLATWWLWLQQFRSSRKLFFLWGAVVGLATATRLDITLLVSAPMFMLLWRQHGRKVVLPILAGAGISFFITDPYLWFMPIQHLVDLVHKFAVHYAHYSSPTKIEPTELFRAISLAGVSVGWSLVLLYRRRLAQIIPVPILVVLFSTSILAVMGILSSKIQLIRYLSPLIIVWEVFLPLFALETFAPTSRSVSADAPPDSIVRSWWIIGLVVLTQLIAAMLI